MSNGLRLGLAGRRAGPGFIFRLAVHAGPKRLQSSRSFGQVRPCSGSQAQISQQFEGSSPAQAESSLS
jgi:hypothetical protein